MDNTKAESNRPNEADFKQLTAKLREYLEQKPYVPKNIEEKLYRRFVHSCYYDLEKAKVAADLFFSIRSTSPELFTDRDPLSPHMQKVFQITSLCKYRISGNRNLWIYQFNDPSCRQYNHLNDAKLFNLAGDAWLIDDDFLQEEDIIISDTNEVSFKVVMKISFSVIKTMFTYQQEAMPLRIKQVHIINAPSVIHRIFSMLKPFINKNIYEAIHFHTPKSTTLYEYLSKDELLEDFGGTKGKMADYFAKTMACFMKKRELLIDDNLWRIDSRTIKKEKKEKVDTKLTKMHATPEICSLRALSID